MGARHLRDDRHDHRQEAARVRDASKNAKRNKDIVGPGFLDAGNHPAIRFRADDVASSATGVTAIGSVTVSRTD